MVAVCIVLRNPNMSAEGAMVAMIFAREGARPEMTPIWIPRDPNYSKRKRQEEEYQVSAALMAESKEGKERRTLAKPARA
jgi:hypothetical protein